MLHLVLDETKTFNLQDILENMPPFGEPLEAVVPALPVNEDIIGLLAVASMLVAGLLVLLALVRAVRWIARRALMALNTAKSPSIRRTRSNPAGSGYRKGAHE
ncbi:MULTISPECIES: hypothetical protein [unclassified Xanthobacter]|uniref:hypothetical protein n=1 Tax=unclassified Xanthobacter TaxID=2623496 RepID=UPI001F42DFE8|nr:MULTISPECIES: hypothetical protein [unclassified Xanthobacter]